LKTLPTGWRQRSKAETHTRRTATAHRRTTCRHLEQFYRHARALRREIGPQMNRPRGIGASGAVGSSANRPRWAVNCGGSCQRTNTPQFERVGYWFSSAARMGIFQSNHGRTTPRGRNEGTR
jgi:hypothetical protein